MKKKPKTYEQKMAEDAREFYRSIDALTPKIKVTRALPPYPRRHK
jgi:hypothetical protein